MSDTKIRPVVPVEHVTQRRPFAVGQVWSVDDDGVGRDWFVLTPTRIVALFAGASDYTPRSIYHVYGDRLWLKATATVYAADFASEPTA